MKSQTKTEVHTLKITIQENPTIEETQVHIICPEMTAEIEEIVAGIGLIGHTFAGKKDGEIFFIPMKDIFYFEAVEGKVFFYTAHECYEAAVRLYKIEETLQNAKFARISKSAIANLSKMRSIKPEENSRLLATLTNGEKILVSRQYVAEIKQKLGV